MLDGRDRDLPFAIPASHIFYRDVIRSSRITLSRDRKTLTCTPPEVQGLAGVRPYRVFRIRNIRHENHCDEPEEESLEVARDLLPWLPINDDFSDVVLELHGKI